MSNSVEWQATFGDSVKKVTISLVQGSYHLYVDNWYWGSFEYYTVAGVRSLYWPWQNNTVLYTDDITELIAVIHDHFTE